MIAMYHYPPANQSLIGKHTASPDCKCGPDKIVKRKQASSGRGGRHQGYRTEVSYQHKFIEQI